MDKKTLALLLLVSLPFVSACSQGTPTVLSNDEFGYELTLPPGWSLRQERSEAFKDFADRSNKTYHNEGIYGNRKGWYTQVVVLGKNEEETFGKVKRKKLFSISPDAGFVRGNIEKSRDYFRNGYQHKEIIYDAKSVMAQEKCLATFVDREDTILIILSWSALGSFDAARNDFDSIARSLQFPEEE